MTPLDLDALERAARAATPGPWAYEPHGDSGDYGVGVMVGHGDDDHPVSGYQEPGECIIVEPVAPEVSNALDAAFISLANPAAILAFIAAHRALQERVEGAEKDGSLSDFQRGYLIACANVENLHRDAVVGADVAIELGVSWQQIEKADFCEYDLNALKKLRNARDNVFPAARTKAGEPHEQE